MDINHEDGDRKQFWKKNTKPLPGRLVSILLAIIFVNYVYVIHDGFSRPSPKQELNLGNKPKSGSSTTSFQDFQASVSDAWDMDDDEFSIISGLTGTLSRTDLSGVNVKFLDARISKKVSHSAALNVINTHRSSASVSEGSPPKTHTTNSKNIIKDETPICAINEDNKDKDNNLSEDVRQNNKKLEPE